MNKLSKYTSQELREELDRRIKEGKNAQGYVRCKDCLKPEVCKFVGKLNEGVWRHCDSYIDNEVTI